MGAGRPHRSRGFTYLGLLLAIAVLGIGLSAASEVWSTMARRQKLEQLESIGDQYVKAIGSYYESSPAGAKTFPRTIDDLLLDKRFPFVRRHLRQAYTNPLVASQPPRLVVEASGGFRGVEFDTAQGEKGSRQWTYAPR